MSTPKLAVEDFVYISVICSLNATKFSDFKHIVGMRYFLGANHCTKIFFCVCPQWGSWPYISRNFLIWTHLLNASWKKKKRSYACTFPVQRKEINVVKINVVKCNTMRYSSRKLSHEKVITTTCNFWRQIACSFLVKRGNVLLLAELHAREARARGRSPIAK